MSKVVTIPKDRNPFVVIVNGVKHSYPAGVTTEVPDEVADVIEKYEGAKPKPAPYKPSGSAGGEKTWLLYSPDDDDVNFVIAEIDSAYSGNPVYIEWDTLKAMNTNEIMRRLVGNYGDDACVGTHRSVNGEGEIHGIIVRFHSVGVWSGKMHTQDKYYNITADGIEFYGMTDGEEVALEGGTLSDGK